MSLREQVSSVDELEMATTRLRLRFPDEAEPTTAQMNIIEPVAVRFCLYILSFISVLMFFFVQGSKEC